MKLLIDIYDWLQKNVRPPSAFSWQTLILLSLFSYYMAFLATEYVSYLLINFAWIFLILGVFWGTTTANQFRVGYDEKAKKDGFPLSPWITGALVSIYIFGGYEGEITRETIIYWPVISAVIASIPDFLGENEAGGLKLKAAPLQKRQNLVVLFGTQLLLSCWFQFTFVVQDWLVQYPSLMADDFQQSAFVMKQQSATSTMPRGGLILNAMEPKLVQQLGSRPWSEVERLLLKEERAKLINTIAAQTKQQLQSVEEDELWQVTSGVSSRASGYNLELEAIWEGPHAKPQKYSVVKPCQITQVYPTTNARTAPSNGQPVQPSEPTSQVECEPLRGWGIGDPIIANDT